MRRSIDFAFCNNNKFANGKKDDYVIKSDIMGTKMDMIPPNFHRSVVSACFPCRGPS